MDYDNQQEKRSIMKNFLNCKIKPAALCLAFIMSMSLFASCGKSKSEIKLTPREEFELQERKKADSRPPLDRDEDNDVDLVNDNDNEDSPSPEELARQEEERLERERREQEEREIEESLEESRSIEASESASLEEASVLAVQESIAASESASRKAAEEAESKKKAENTSSVPTFAQQPQYAYEQVPAAKISEEEEGGGQVNYVDTEDSIGDQQAGISSMGSQAIAQINGKLYIEEIEEFLDENGVWQTRTVLNEIDPEDYEEFLSEHQPREVGAHGEVPQAAADDNTGADTDTGTSDSFDQALLGLSNTPTGSTNSGGSVSASEDLAGAAIVIMNRINQQRAAMGLAQMVNDQVMQSIANIRAPQVAASYQASGDATGHNHYGQRALDWIAVNYGVNCGMAENTGFFSYGLQTADEVYTDYFNSPGHAANMFNPNLTRMGVALWNDPDGRTYVVMNFGY